ncbi:hypothetical protein AVEN_121217-1 [Araneus ventricosus]|uniref:Uncharacterized protein n=1 Tax=Araneus ventricosus TaxID=182803 RepID=A0A4Y2MDX7_ARAVE|nr:hypothetical protein AVEN_121217-1 [Araneus ventricosus]
MGVTIVIFIASTTRIGSVHRALHKAFTPREQLIYLLSNHHEGSFTLLACLSSHKWGFKVMRKDKIGKPLGGRKEPQILSSNVLRKEVSPVSPPESCFKKT